LVLESDGTLYGTTIEGGCCEEGSNGFGTVFRLTEGPTGSWVEKRYAFTNSGGGEFPYGNIVIDTTGNVYGTTSGNAGVVYEIKVTARNMGTDGTFTVN
jgi:uncharacterized repeat protein (TIGR03803 family)